VVHPAPGIIAEGVHAVGAEAELDKLETADWKRALRVAAAQEGGEDEEARAVLLDCEACGSKALVPRNLVGEDGWIACPNSDCQRR
jgi:hypothetical protein